jgi:hypothetical protein
MGKKPPPEDTIRKKANLLIRRTFYTHQTPLISTMHCHGV